MSEGTQGPRFAIGSAIFGFGEADDLEPALRLVSAAGFPGIELYPHSIPRRYYQRPGELRDLVDGYGLEVVTVSNGASVTRTNFLDPAARQDTIADHLALARDLLAVLGCEHFKINVGSRPPGGPSDTDLQNLAATLNELGRATADVGVKLAPHPHVWGPMERPEEIVRIMELTDPRHVYMTPDTGHINLGGGEPLEIIARFYDRIAAYHWKDTKAAYRGYRGPTPTREMHHRENLYRDIGSGGVDHVGVWDLLRARGYRGWITLDLDPPRPSEGEGTVEEKIAINKRFLTDTLGVEHL